MRKEQKQTEGDFDKINNLSLEQKKEISNLPYQVKERIEKLDERSKEEIEKKLPGSATWTMQRVLKNFPRELENGLKKILRGYWE